MCAPTFFVILLGALNLPPENLGALVIAPGAVSALTLFITVRAALNLLSSSLKDS